MRRQTAFYTNSNSVFIIVFGGCFINKLLVWPVSQWDVFIQDLLFFFLIFYYDKDNIWSTKDDEFTKYNVLDPPVKSAMPCMEKRLMSVNLARGSVVLKESMRDVSLALKWSTASLIFGTHSVALYNSSSAGMHPIRPNPDSANLLAPNSYKAYQFTIIKFNLLVSIVVRIGTTYDKG